MERRVIDSTSAQKEKEEKEEKAIAKVKVKVGRNSMVNVSSVAKLGTGKPSALKERARDRHLAKAEAGALAVESGLWTPRQHTGTASVH